MAEKQCMIINHYPEKTAPQEWRTLAERSFFMLREYLSSEDETEQEVKNSDECDLYKAIP